MTTILANQTFTLIFSVSWKEEKKIEAFLKKRAEKFESQRSKTAPAMIDFFVEVNGIRDAYNVLNNS